MDLVVPKGQKNRSLTDLPESYTCNAEFAAPSDPCRLFDAKEGPPLTLFGNAANCQVSPELLCQLINKLQPEYTFVAEPAINLYRELKASTVEYDEPGRSSVLKRRARWISWIAKFDSLKSKSKIIVGLGCESNPSDRRQTARLVLEQVPDCFGGGIYLPTPCPYTNDMEPNNWESKWKERLRATASAIPQSMPKLLFGVQSLKHVVEAIQMGFSIFDNSWIDKLVLDGCALIVDFDQIDIAKLSLPEKGVLQISSFEYVLNLNQNDEPSSENVVQQSNSVWRSDKSPLSPICTCWTCQRHTRAYIHHLLNVHDMLAYVCLMEHNLFQLRKFMESIQRHISNDTFQDQAAKFGY